MRKPILDFTQLLEELLLSFPALVDLLRDRQTSFVIEYLKWLEKSEQILRENRETQTSTIAGIRSRIISTQQYNMTSANRKSRSRRKATQQIAAQSMQEVQHILIQVFQPHKQKIEEAKELIQQMLFVALQNGTLQSIKFNNFTDQIQYIWALFSDIPEIKGGVQKVLSLVVYVDAIRILAELASTTDFSVPQVVRSVPLKKESNNLLKNDNTLTRNTGQKEVQNIKKSIDQISLIKDKDKLIAEKKQSEFDLDNEIYREQMKRYSKIAREIFMFKAEGNNNSLKITAETIDQLGERKEMDALFLNSHFEECLNSLLIDFENAVTDKKEIYIKALENLTQVYLEIIAYFGPKVWTPEVHRMLFKIKEQYQKIEQLDFDSIKDAWLKLSKTTAE